MIAPIAQEHGVTVAVEPLNRKDCNILNTVSETAAVVQAVDHPAIRLLVDSYHLMLDHDRYDDIVKYGDLLAHAHIATVPNRLAPAAEDCDLSHFFAALKQANYQGRISIESNNIPNPATVLPSALKLMRDLSSD
jgi:sugar phosphate isomerase/epimerase